MKLRVPLAVFFSARIFTYLSFLAYTFILFRMQPGQDFFYLFIERLATPWDCWIYESISNHGYTEKFRCAFFPLMPVLTKTLSLLTGMGVKLSGIILSNVFCLAGVVALYALAHRQYGGKTALYAVILFMVQPASVFYSTLYTESLFVLLTVLCFYFMDRKMWLAAALAGALATATRNTGIFLIPAFVVSYVIAERNFSFRTGAWLKEFFGALDPRVLLYSLLMASGIIAYMFHLNKLQGNPLMFYEAAKLWPERSGLIFPFWDLLLHIKNFTVQFQLKVTPERNNMSFIYFTVMLLLIIFFRKRIKPEQLLYSGLVYLLLAMQPNLTSSARYVSSIFPFWIMLGLFVSENRKSTAWMLFLVCASLAWQLYMNLRWFLVYWVA